MPTMSAATLGNDKLGWIGAGRMGFAMAARIAKAEIGRASCRERV